MSKDDFKEKIIHAIQNQLMLEIRYRKVSREWDKRIIAPYDLFPKRDKNEFEKYFLQGCSEKCGELSGFSTYLENIEVVDILDKNFSGEEVKKVLSYPNKQPYISRNW